MNDIADGPYQHLTEEERAELPEYWWYEWLIFPIKRGDLPAMQRHLARMPECLHEEIPYTWDPFILAAGRPDPAALRLLLQYWAVHPTPDAPPPDERGFPLFYEACVQGALETARYILDEQPALAHLHALDESGWSPILLAAKSFVSWASEERSEISERNGRTQFDAQVARERVQRSEALVRVMVIQCSASPSRVPGPRCCGG